MWQGNVFTPVCLFTGGGRGCLPMLTGPWSLVLSQGRGGGTPLSCPKSCPGSCLGGGGYACPRVHPPSQDRGTLPGQDRGAPMDRIGIPSLARIGVPPFPLDSRVSACYAAGRTPLAVTQEDFLVPKMNSPLICLHILSV